MTISTASYCQVKSDGGRYYSREQREAIATKILTLENRVEIDSVNLAACDSTCTELKKSIMIVNDKAATYQRQALYCDTLSNFYKANSVYWHDEYNRVDTKLQQYQKWTPYAAAGIGILGLVLGILIAK